MKRQARANEKERANSQLSAPINPLAALPFASQRGKSYSANPALNVRPQVLCTESIYNIYELDVQGSLSLSYAKHTTEITSVGSPKNERQEAEDF